MRSSTKCSSRALPYILVKLTSNQAISGCREGAQKRDQSQAEAGQETEADTKSRVEIEVRSPSMTVKTRSKADKSECR